MNSQEGEQQVTSVRQYRGLVGWLGLTFAAAGIGAVASAKSEAFYRQLAQPSWSPPAWIFGPVWSVLYVLMGVAAWQVWRQGGFSRRRFVLTLYLIQLVLNALWAWLFFAWHRGALAFFDIVFLWLVLGATLLGFWRLRPVGGMLLLPYLCWVSFAAVLNYVIWQMNMPVLG